MSVTDAQFRIGVAAAGVVMVATMAAVRFCGSIPLPDKPAPPSRSPVQSQFASPVVYQDFLAKDAAFAGVATPTLEQMSRKLAFRADEARHVIEPGQPPLTLAGLELSAQKKDRSLVLAIRNVTDTALAYTVVSTPAPNSSACASARPTALNAMALTPGETVTRVECVWRTNTAIVVSRVETAEVLPLQAWYLSMVPPTKVGIPERVARAHQPPPKTELCSPVMAQALRTGLERGQIVWRDLVDFFARHRCATYQFPLNYRAFRSDNERPIPAVAPSR
ncbi:MAG: hypothetical protein AB7P03_02920 [Kofleriaceae bacterium]